MNCPKCGAGLSNLYYNCVKCGADPIEIEKRGEMEYCLECGYILGQGLKFCSGCGADIASGKTGKPNVMYKDEAMNCPKCGEKLYDSFNYCLKWVAFRPLRQIGDR